MNTELRIITLMKDFTLSLDNILINYPKKERILTDNIKKTSFEIVELLYLANISYEKEQYQRKALGKLSMLDFYFECSYKKHYISEKQCLNKSDQY